MPKIIGNTTATPNPRPDWNQTDPAKADYIKNKPIILTEEDIVGLIDDNVDVQIQSDWNQTDETKIDYIKNKPIVLDKFSIDESGNPLFDGKPLASEGASGSVSINPRVTMAQTVALLLENSATNVSVEAPEVASTEESYFATRLFDLTMEFVMLYAPAKDGTLIYTDPVSYESITFPVSAGGIYEFYMDMDVYEAKVNSYVGVGVFAFFKSKLLN